MIFIIFISIFNEIVAYVLFWGFFICITYFAQCYFQPMQFWVPVTSLACQHLPFPLQASLYQIPLQPNLKKKKIYAKYGLHHLVTIFHFCERKCACCIHFFLFGCYKNINKIWTFLTGIIGELHSAAKKIPAPLLAVVTISDSSHG